MSDSAFKKIIIVGAGPAGSSLAHLLSERGIPTTLVERQGDFSREFRGEGLMPSGFEALCQMGLEDQVRELPQVKIRGMEIYQKGKFLFRLEPDLFRQDPGTNWISQPALLEMIISKCERKPGFNFFRGWRCVGLVERGGRVRGIKVAQGSEIREIEGDIIIGADGRASILRKLINPKRHIYKQIIDVVWFKVPCPEFIKNGIGLATLSPGNAVLSFPVYDNQLQVGWLIKKGHFGAIKRQGKEALFQNLISSLPDHFADYLEKNYEKISDYFVLDVACSRLPTWHHRGVLRIGDASHTKSPVAAQGINLALRDSIVVANELIPVIRGGRAAEESIDEAFKRIQHKRMKEVRRIQKLQQAPPKILFQQNILARLLVRNLPWLSRRALVQRAVTRIADTFIFGYSDVTLKI
ncbi:MAG: FAD-dependent monooxygenase [Pseudomonadota bacterium]|nr:FAD-dependent monooxygenase [Pseudomonadota bacterium]